MAGSTQPTQPQQKSIFPSESPASGLPLDDLKKMPTEEVDKLDVKIDDEGDIVMNDDGSADYVLGEEKKFDTTSFHQNLAEVLDEGEMQAIADDLMEKIEADKKARQRRDEQYEEGLRRTGMGEDAPGGAAFQGASKVVHPMLVEACVDFCAAAIKELMPPTGPAKTKIEGKDDEHKYNVSVRQEAYLNWQLLEQISEFAEEFEQLLTQLPMGGSQYMKFWHDKKMRRICTEFVPIDDVLLPFACSDFYTAQRITHRQRLTDFVFEERVKAEFYRDVDENIAAGSDASGSPSTPPEQTKAAEANNKIEGRDPGAENVDGERIVFEVNTFCELSIDGEECMPYLVSIDDQTKKVAAIYRNWEPDDDSCSRLDWMVEFGFIAWRGAYKIGMPHLIGGLSAAATGSLRAILDSAHFNNMPGFLRLKGARMGGQSKEVNPAEGIEIEASAAVDDIRKLIMSTPYNPPSLVLFQLIGWLTDAAKGVVTTAEEKIADAGNQMPVGTALALMESGAKVYSSIHKRLHRSMSRVLKIVARLNKKHLSVGEQLAKLGEVLATRNDFAEPLAVIPVSDPNIFSEAQRFAQIQMVLDLAQGVDPKTGAPTATAQLHNLYEACKALYEIAKIPNFARFLPPPPQPQELNAAAENMAALMNQPLMAFPEQKHAEHIEAHIRFIVDPFLGGSPQAAGKTMPAMMEHIKQHMGYLYLDLMAALMQAATGMDIEEMMQDKGLSPKTDKLIATASKIVHARMAQRFAPMQPIFNQIMQQITNSQQPQPMDPAAAMLQANREKLAAQAQENDKKLAAQAQDKQQDRAMDQNQHLDKMSLSAAQLDQKSHTDNADDALRATELQIQDGQHKDDLDAEDVKQLRDLAHEANQNDLDRVHDHIQQSNAQAATAQNAEADRQHQAAEAQAGREYDAMTGVSNQLHDESMANADRAHQANEAAAGRAFDANENAASRMHQSSESAADRMAAAQEAEAQRKAQEKSQKADHQQQAKSQQADHKQAERLAKQKAKSESKKPKGKK